MLNDNLDWNAARESYAGNGWVVIENILKPEIAEEIRNSLVTETPWNLSYTRVPRGKPNVAGPPEFITCTSEQLARLTNEEKAGISSEVLQRARHWYAFHFYKYDLEKTQNKVLNEFYQSIGNEKYFGFIRYVTSEIGVNRRNAMATCYRPGCFLKRHSDEAPENRRVAHIFGFTKGWQAHWGGLLHILDEKGNVRHALIPGFNTLTLFKVPTEHFVSQVASYTPESRYSVTGWFMTNQP